MPHSERSDGRSRENTTADGSSHGPDRGRGFRATFVLRREVDVTGVSGTGILAEGAVFSSGVAVVHWLGNRQSTVVWPGGIDDVTAIHGHGGHTRIVWDNEAEEISTERDWGAP